MKLSKKKATRKSSVAARNKQSFDLKAFSNSVNALNRDNYGSAPLPVRLFLLALIAGLIFLAAWFALIDRKREEIKSAESDEVTLLEEYKVKESKARYLDEYKDQIAKMEQDFAQLLSQLPQKNQVPELTEGINMVGSGSGIRFQDISAEQEIDQELFIEQPIKITAIGEYHQFGNFLTGIAALPRIITMHDFEIKNQQPNLEVMPELQLVLNTKTYRAKTLEETEATTTDANAAANTGEKK